jgi:small subunit ribosomal protein S28e
MEEQKQQPQQPKKPMQAPVEEKKGAVRFTEAVAASVEEIIGRAGTRGEAIQVRCKITDGRDKGKVIRRNIKGPIRIGDILMLRETEIEAQKLVQSRG